MKTTGRQTKKAVALVMALMFFGTQAGSPIAWAGTAPIAGGTEFDLLAVDTDGVDLADNGTTLPGDRLASADATNPLSPPSTGPEPPPLPEDPADDGTIDDDMGTDGETDTTTQDLIGDLQDEIDRLEAEIQEAQDLYDQADGERWDRYRDYRLLSDEYDRLQDEIFAEYGDEMFEEGFWIERMDILASLQEEMNAAWADFLAAKAAADAALAELNAIKAVNEPIIAALKAAIAALESIA